MEKWSLTPSFSNLGGLGDRNGSSTDLYHGGDLFHDIVSPGRALCPCAVAKASTVMGKGTIGEVGHPGGARAST